MSFNIALLCKKFGFLSCLFCPAFLPVTWSHHALWSHHAHKVENASELQLTSISDQYLLYVFMYSWVYDGAPQPCFSRYMVDLTLMTTQMTTIFVFHFIWGHVPGGWICYLYSSNEGPLVISMKISPNIKTGTSYKSLFTTLCDEICILPSFNLILDISIT